MLGLERAADVVQRLGVPDDQISSGQKVVVKRADDVFLHLVVEVDDHIAAENDMRTFHPPQLQLVVQIDLTKADSARHAISVAQAAIDMVSSMRSDFGAMQNRLDHTINNLSVQEENITAAESRIRDVDMAKEMMAYTKNNILVQSAQAMLAQANQVPQGVLQLLQ